MAKKRAIRKKPIQQDVVAVSYDDVLTDLVQLLESSRRAAARTVNALMTATYWEIGRRIVDWEQAGAVRAEYGEQLIEQLAVDLTALFGRGFSRINLRNMRRFFLSWPIQQTLSVESANTTAVNTYEIRQTLSVELGNDPSIAQTLSAQSLPATNSLPRFPLPWSHYIRLLAVKKEDARHFYETEAIRGGWSVRQLERQIDSQFYERTLLSRNKSSLLEKGQQPRPADEFTVAEAIKDPYLLEFLDLKDEYSESDLEAALIANIEAFLMELGGDFAFVGRQRRLRIDDEWYRIDLLFFHRRLRSLVIIDLKLGKFTHADAGQMHLYLNYAREHWVVEGENPPVGIILCAAKGESLVKYALESLPNKIVAAQYRTALPDETALVAKLVETQRRIEFKRGNK
jgi:predicted nuclease of restriction endonuclease-like (RecB) superfamily